jgi:uncharacterized protein with HEPN domain
LQDVLDNIDLAIRFSATRTEAELANDLMALYAVEHAILIVSEAIRRLPEDLKARHPEIDWAAAGIGNKIRHDYDAMDVGILLNTVRDSLPGLREVIAAELDHWINRPPGP